MSLSFKTYPPYILQLTGTAAWCSSQGCKSVYTELIHSSNDIISKIMKQFPSICMLHFESPNYAASIKCTLSNFAKYVL